MRVWDVHPGYLNRQSLLGEHREIHGMISILLHGKKGYSSHPETLRWKGHLRAAVARHDQLVTEMRLRGFRHLSPVAIPGGKVSWPTTYIDPPGKQFEILKLKYQGKAQGRIPLPRNIQELWAQHKYSVMARDSREYRRIGRSVARLSPREPLDPLATELVEILRIVPASGTLRNAIEHMAGYPVDHPYIRHSTALSDLLTT